MLSRQLIVSFMLAVFTFGASALHASDGKLLATAGLVQLEGAGGGGIVPWATLTGYDTQDQWSSSATATRVRVDDFELAVWGASVSINDRVELSWAQQSFDLLNAAAEIRQNIVGVKAKLVGDVVYGDWPQIAAGVQHKTLLDKNIAEALGADDDDAGTDFYLAATRVHLGLAAGYNVVWNLAARWTKANQLGLLGFGGDEESSYSLVFEGSVGVLLSRSFAVGVEYRQKPDNLAAAKEDDWRDVFITYIPNKSVSLTAAFAQLGKITDGIAGDGDQDGLYLSLSANL